MATCPDALVKQITENGEEFEKKFIACVRNDLKLFDKVKDIVCIKPDSKDKQTHFDDFECYNHNVIYAAVRDYNKIFDGAPTAFEPMPETFFNEWLTTQASQANFLQLNEIPETIKYYSDNILSVKTEAYISHLASIGISPYLKHRRAGNIIRHFTLNDLNLDDLTLMCDKAVNFLAKLDSSQKLVNDVPDYVSLHELELYNDPNTVLVEQLVSNMPLLDDALGGWRKGSAYMVIGGTGSGKTIIACQLAISFASANKANGLFISTEQRHDELYRRMVSSSCSIPHKTISRGIFENKLTDREKDRLIEFRQNMLDVNMGEIRIVNWGNFEKVQGTSILSNIEKQIDLYEEQTGKKLDFVILDWIGGALGSMAEAGDNVRHIYQEAADSMDELARKRNIVTVALAQAHVSANNKIQIWAADLAECKSMTRNFAGVVGITALYSEEYNKQLSEENKKRRESKVGYNNVDEAVAYNIKQYLYVSKARYGIQKAIPFKRDYEYQRMTPWV